MIYTAASIIAMLLLVVMLVIILNLMGCKIMNEMEVSNKSGKLFDFSNEINQLEKMVLKEDDKSKAVDSPEFNYHIALLLAVYFGWCGLDRFYVGRVGTGILKLVTFGGFGLLWLFDAIFLLLNKTRDAYGRELVGSDKKEMTVLSLLALNGMFHYLYLGFYGLALVKVGILIFSLIFYSANIPALGTLLLLLYVTWAIIDLYLILSARINADVKGVPVNNAGTKYQSIALIFAVVGGFLALDRFYLGHRTLGLLKLFSFGGFGLWVMVDFILIILNSLKDSEGNEMIQG